MTQQNVQRKTHEDWTSKECRSRISYGTSTDQVPKAIISHPSFGTYKAIYTTDYFIGRPGINRLLT